MQITNFYRQHLHLTDEVLLQEAQAVSFFRTLKKGEVLYQQGEPITCVYFLIEGTIRGFLLDPAGNDITDCFVTEPGTALVPGADIEGIAPFGIAALEECRVLGIPSPDVKRLMERFPIIHELYQNILARGYKIHWELKMVAYQYPAMERYKWFLDNYPGLIDRVPNRHVASFLNMTPVTLSRLRGALDRQERGKAGRDSRG